MIDLCDVDDDAFRYSPLVPMANFYCFVVCSSFVSNKKKSSIIRITDLGDLDVDCALCLRLLRRDVGELDDDDFCFCDY